MEDQVEDTIRSRAQRAVLGVATANQAGSVDDASLMIKSFVNEEIERGAEEADAYAELFTASMTWFNASLHQQAALRRVPTQKIVTELALEHAKATA